MATQPPDDTPEKPAEPSAGPPARKPAPPVPRKPGPPPLKKPSAPASDDFGPDPVKKKATPPPSDTDFPAVKKKAAPPPLGGESDASKKKAVIKKAAPKLDEEADDPAAETTGYPGEAPDSDEAPGDGAITNTRPPPGKKKKKEEGIIAGKDKDGIVAGKDKDGIAKPKAKKLTFNWPNFKKAAPTGVWGVDLGQCGLKAVRLEEINGEVVATAFEYIEHPKILSQPDADPDELTRDALTKFLAQNKIGADSVAISVPGQSGLARFVKLPPVEEKKIADIVRFEAKQQIPFNLDEVVWDYQKLGAGEVMDGLALDAEIGLFAMKRDAVNRYLQHFKDVKVEVHQVQMAPLALCNFLAFDILKKSPDGGTATEDGAEAPRSDDKGCIAALDIGADSSSLVVTDGERVIWQRPIPVGGNHFTRALTKDLKLTFAKAEHLKRNATKSPDLKAILAALKPVLNDFVGEVQRSLNFFTSSHRSASIDYLVGLGNAFRLPGLQSYLKEKLQLNVVKLQKFERLTGATVVGDQRFIDNVLTFAVAYGLALQGLKRSRLHTNLLPSEIREERVIRAKKPMAVAAAGILLLGLGMFAFGKGMSVRAWKSEEVKAATIQAKSVADAAKKAEVAYKKAKDDADKEEAAVNGLLAGQGEFRDWVELESFVRGSVPQPDGTNLPAASELLDPYQKYFETPPTPAQITARREAFGQDAMSGRLASHRMRDVQLGLAKAVRPPKPFAPPTTTGPGVPVAPRLPDGRPAGAGPGAPNPFSGEEALPKGIDDLIQINIEAIETRYVDDLEGFWNRFKGTRQYSEGNLRGFKTLPIKAKERGWLVEVRGYTYHNASDAFIKETFLDNLAQHGLPMADKAEANGSLPDRGPVINRVSHFLLYTSYSPDKLDEPMKPMEVANHTYLDEVLSGGPAAVGAGQRPAPRPGTDPRSGASGARAAWTSIGLFATAPTTTPGGLSPAAVPPGTTPPATTTTPSEGTRHRRTEFVILFLWREPTPSDILRGQNPDAPPPAPTGPALPGGPGR